MRTILNAAQVKAASQNECINNCYYNCTEPSFRGNRRQLFVLYRLQRALSCYKFNVGKDVFVTSALSQEKGMSETVTVTKWRPLQRCWETVTVQCFESQGNVALWRGKFFRSLFFCGKFPSALFEINFVLYDIKYSMIYKSIVSWNNYWELKTSDSCISEYVFVFLFKHCVVLLWCVGSWARKVKPRSLEHLCPTATDPVVFFLTSV